MSPFLFYSWSDKFSLLFYYIKQSLPAAISMCKKTQQNCDVSVTYMWLHCSTYLLVRSVELTWSIKDNTRLVNFRIQMKRKSIASPV